MIDRIWRYVPSDQWHLSDSLGSRRDALQKPNSHLLSDVARQSEAAQARIKLRWHEACEFPGYFRVVAVVPLEERTFDQLLNGCSGYRAQYYLSPEEGVLFNRDLIDSILPALNEAYRLAPLPVTWDLCRLSLLGPHSKMWVFEEESAFNDAAPDTLNPPRWVRENAALGRRAPLPSHLSIDVKGTFLHPHSHEIRVDDLKLERPCDIFRRGFT